MGEVTFSIADADSFLSDAIYLEHLVSTFSTLEKTDEIFFKRLNRSITDPENLALLREAIGSYSFDLWVEKISIGGNVPTEFLKLANTLLGRKQKSPVENSSAKFTLLFAAPAKKFLRDRAREPNSQLTVDTYNALEKLKRDPDYQGLNTHKGKYQKAFISYISKGGAGNRLIWSFGPQANTIIILRMITHDDYSSLGSTL